MPHGAGDGPARTAWHPGTAAAARAWPAAAAGGTARGTAAAAAASPSSSGQEEGPQVLALGGGGESHFLPPTLPRTGTPSETCQAGDAGERTSGLWGHTDLSLDPGSAPR